MAKAVCGRFAPTPSGRMHLGNVFCALLAWLSAKKQGGTITLRIEDLDKPRCPAGSDMLLEDDLHWLGLEWDTGGSAGGKDAPYYQSRRFDIYAAYFAQLQKLGLTYPCFCNRAELHAAQAPHLSDGRILYAGTCRHLTAEQTAAKARTKDPAQRLRLPDTAVSFIDGHYGPYTQNLAAECGDIILRRSDGVYAYQLAVVVDDALMGITEIVRGCDLLSSTPQQLYLYQLLGFTPPAFIHVPLLQMADVFPNATVIWILAFSVSILSVLSRSSASLPSWPDCCRHLNQSVPKNCFRCSAGRKCPITISSSVKSF